MRLSSLVPSISAESVSHLEASGIRTDSELLFTPIFDVYKRLPPKSLTLADLARLLDMVTDLVAPEPILATDLLKAEEDASSEGIELCVGNAQVDSLLQGLGGKRVIEISGDRDVGKSVLALNIALEFLISCANESVAWVDTSGDFSPAFAYDFLSSRNHAHPDSVLARLQVSLVFDLDALHSVLDELFEPLQGVRPRIIVIDAITPLLGPLLTGVTSHGHALTTDLMQRLRTIANDFGCTILVINNATLKEPYDASKKGALNLERKPALGPTFTFMTDSTIWLSRKFVEEDGEEVEQSLIQILKSRNKTAGGSLAYQISEGRFLALSTLYNTNMFWSPTQ